MPAEDSPSASVPPPAWGDSQEELQATRRGEPGVHRRRLFRGTLFLILAGGLISTGWTLGRITEQPPLRRGILPGEFEHQEGLLVSWPANLSQSEQEALRRVVTEASRHLQVVVTLPDYATQQRAQQMLDEQSFEDRASVQFVRTPVNSMWVRDFGPFVLKSFSGSWEMIDVDYGMDRSGDDGLPRVLSDLFRMKATRAPFLMEGGNVLSNGAGLILTTQAALERNAARYRYSEQRISDYFREYLGADHVVYLEYLQGEPSAHVDIFATFVACDAVVVGQYSPDEDPVNAAILDRNAERLSGLTTACGPLRVYRIPMPPRSGDSWPTYTNVVYANRSLLVPTFGEDSERLDEALAVYRSLLPDWQVTAVDSGALLRKGGGLHCATMNLFRMYADE